MAIRFLGSPRPILVAAWVMLLAALSTLVTPDVHAAVPARKVLIRDVTEIQGVRDNQLVGYGLVVGLRGTGDRQQTFFTVQTLANTLQRMGVQIAPGVVVVKNVAAVFVTAKLPAFARPGVPLDVTVSSIGDAKSLEGGVLLMTALKAPDGQVYAEAQGPLQLAGYSEGAGGQSKAVNHPTVAVISGGATTERDSAVDLSRFSVVSLLLHNSHFTAASSQPGPLSNGRTVSTQQTNLAVKDAPALSIQLEEGANVEELIRGLHAIGATSRDVIGIIQAIKEAGGLQAELEVI